MSLCFVRIKFADTCNSYNFKVLNEKKIYSMYCDMSNDDFYINLS